MKLFKKLAILGMALSLCFGAGAALTACGDESDSSSQEQTTSYSFKLLNADDTPAVGYKIQLCKTDGSCLAFKAVGADGKVSYPVNPTEAYEVHVLNENDEQVEFVGTKTLAANYDGGEISLKLKD